MNIQELNISKSLAGRSIGAILIDTGVLTPEGAERILRLQKEQDLRFGDAAIQLGLLKESDIQFALSRQFDYAYLPSSGDKPVSEELVAAYQPFSPQVEQLRALRSQLMLRWFDRESRRTALAIVGADRGDGRSYLAANLAIVFSQLGERTLLIDADMRNPRQHQLFKVDNRLGLSSVLGGRTDASPIQRIAAFDNLALLPAGPTPPNPQELLSRPAFSLLLEQTAMDYDVVLIDTSSTASGADAQTISGRAGAALVLARKDASSLRSLTDLVSSLTHAGVAVVGSVLNCPGRAGK